MNDMEQSMSRIPITTAIANNKSYHSSRRQKFVKALSDLRESRSITLTEATRIIKASQYDLQHSNQLNTEQIMRHRDSIEAGIEHLCTTELESLRACSTSSSTRTIDDTRKWQVTDLITCAKRDVLDNQQRIDTLQSTVDKLKTNNKTLSKSQISSGISAVNTRLLQIIDELLPKHDESLIVEGTANNIEDAQCREQADQTRDCVAKLRHAMSLVSALRPSETAQKELKERLKRIEDLSKEVHARNDVLQDFLLKLKDDQITSTPQPSASYSEIKELERKIHDEPAMNFLEETKTIQNVSLALLHKHFLRISLESPLLAENAIPSTTDLEGLANLWKQESQSRSRYRDNQLAVISRGVMEELDKVASSLEQGKKLHASWVYIASGQGIQI